MGLFLSYTWRNLTTRKLTTALTVLGMGLVVFVFAAVLMLGHGLQETLVATGSTDNAIFVRDGANTETISLVMRSDAQIAKTQSEVAVNAEGKPIAVNEIVVLINTTKREGGDAANVIIRGTNDNVFELRGELVRLTAGRMFTPGTSEVIAGSAVAKNFTGCGLGESVSFAGREWTVVGTFDAGGAGFDSELWGDVDQVQQAFRRNIYSSVTVRLRDPALFEQLKQKMESDPRMTVDVHQEKEYYAKQSQATTTFITVVGQVVSFIFGLGAIVGAMITMYAAVANRTIEIGTLRALGFSRGRILFVFLLESIWIALLGGAVGLVAASFMSLVQVSTTNWDTFSELAFSFALSPQIVVSSLIFALVMGLVGGFLPAVRASRAKIIESLRAA
ncbi:MAG TPA: ABC transporter permease [bacterium]|nr:ABC transporter permease [bacterium]